ncbi:MAG: ParB N-terminal domain-containing protein [Oscillospiraceae bacterium]|nr:ParB N-terminal domain-containing protein [Oscillospiraceae bacterium]
MAKKNSVQFNDTMGAMFSQKAVPASEPNISILNDVSKEQISGERVSQIRRSNIEINARNEVVYDVKELDALAKDISERGIQEPLLLRQRPNGKYVIISGHRRFAANELAIKKYQYDGEYIPCIIRDNISDSIDEREALILNNLQRDKSDYNRMMEIIEMRKCAEERRERGENIVNIRHYLMERLGVSNSEISRFDRIHSSLCSDLMAEFRAERISTNVAHEIAKLDAPAQEFIFSHWERGADAETLSFPIMSRLLEQYQESLAAPELHTGEAVQPKKASAPSIGTVEQGVKEIRESCESILKRIENSDLLDDMKQKKAVLRHLNKIYADLRNLQNELERNGPKNETNEQAE